MTTRAGERPASITDSDLPLASGHGLCDFCSRTLWQRPASRIGPFRLYRLPPRNRMLPVVQGNDCVVALKALGEDTQGPHRRVADRRGARRRRDFEAARCLAVQRLETPSHPARSGPARGREERPQAPVCAAGRDPRRAAEGGVLDLGCCSFQFNGPSTGAGKPAAAPRRRRTAESGRTASCDEAPRWYVAQAFRACATGATPAGPIVRRSTCPPSGLTSSTPQAAGTGTRCSRRSSTAPANRGR